jgi:hypothetical protein
VVSFFQVCVGVLVRVCVCAVASVVMCPSSFYLSCVVYYLGAFYVVCCVWVVVGLVECCSVSGFVFGCWLLCGFTAG